MQPATDARPLFIQWGNIDTSELMDRYQCNGKIWGNCHFMGDLLNMRMTEQVLYVD